MDSKGHQGGVKAQVPPSEMLSYQSTLNSITGARGRYTMELDHYDEVPAPIAPKDHPKGPWRKATSAQLKRTSDYRSGCTGREPHNRACPRQSIYLAETRPHADITPYSFSRAATNLYSTEDSSALRTLPKQGPGRPSVRHT